MTHVSTFWRFVTIVMQRISIAFFAIVTIALLAATGLAFAGAWQWPQLALSINATPIPNAGMYAQIILTVLCLTLCFFLPSNRRILQLERSHRTFSIGMHDVARAYDAVHAQDRKGVFLMASEFDAVKERLAYLRDHPDLGGLEPDILEIAAQMSQISQELAEVYSEEKVIRARGFLKQRQEELELFNQRLEDAKQVSAELKQWLTQVELDESVATAQMERLKEELNVLLPEKGRQRTVRTLSDDVIVDSTTLDNIVIDLPSKAAE